MTRFLLPILHGPSMPRNVVPALTHHTPLGADVSLVTVDEGDALYRLSNIGRAVELARIDGGEVWVSGWGIGGWCGGEALTAGDVHYHRTGHRLYHNAVYLQGPDAEAARGAEAYTPSPFPLLKRIIDQAILGGATTYCFDEPRISYSREDKSGIFIDDLMSIMRYAKKKGLKIALWVAVKTLKDLDVLDELLRRGLIDVVGFTRYYSLGHYEQTPEEYLTPVIHALRVKLRDHGRPHSPVELIGWIQGFDWTGEAEQYMNEIARLYELSGFDIIAIWGGYCVNDQQYLRPQAPDAYYDQIAAIFGGRNPLSPGTGRSSEPNSVA